MAKLKTWQYKNRKKPRKYRTSLGTTDYDIPMFGYRSALIILLVTFLALLIIPAICDLINVNYHLPTVILGGLCSGFLVSFSQFFIERKIGICRSFWIVGGLLSLFVAMMLFLLIYAGIIM